MQSYIPSNKVFRGCCWIGLDYGLAERVGFEPTCELPRKTLSRRPRYDHFGTSPFVSLVPGLVNQTNTCSRSPPQERQEQVIIRRQAEPTRQSSRVVSA